MTFLQGSDQTNSHRLLVIRDTNLIKRVIYKASKPILNKEYTFKRQMSSSCKGNVP